MKTFKMVALIIGGFVFVMFVVWRWTGNYGGVGKSRQVRHASNGEEEYVQQPDMVKTNWVSKTNVFYVDGRQLDSNQECDDWGPDVLADIPQHSKGIGIEPIGAVMTYWILGNTNTPYVTQGPKGTKAYRELHLGTASEMHVVMNDDQKGYKPINRPYLRVSWKEPEVRAYYRLTNK